MDQDNKTPTSPINQSGDSQKNHVNLTSAFSLFSKSWGLVKNNLSTFLAIFLLDIAMIVYGFFVKPAEDSNALAALAGPQLDKPALFSIFVVLSLLFTVLQTILFVRSAQGKKPSVQEIFNEVGDRGIKILLTSILSTLVIVAGFIAFIIPGIFFVAWFIMAPYVAFDKNVSPIEAMKQSKDLSKGNFGAIWGVIIVGILIALPIVIPIVGGIIATTTSIAYSCALALRYEELKKQ